MKKPAIFSILFIALIMLCSCENNITNQTVSNKNTDVSHKVDSVLSLMTLDEKIGQMVQYNGSWDVTGPASGKSNIEKETRLKNGGVGSMLNVVSAKATLEAQKTVMENSRLKIPLVFGFDVIHGYKTIFPVPLGETSSWDLSIMEKSAQIAARESAASGIHWTFAPMLDVSRDARWGRIMEGGGEDPYLISQAGIARVKGFQGENLSDSLTVAACAKHFAGYGFAEGGRDYNTANIGPNELHNIVLPPFKAAADAGVATFMNSFNEIDGIPATGSKMLQRELLKGEWQWDGMVVSDWGSIGEMISHGYAKDLSQATEIAVLAGSDMDMESYAYQDHLKELVKNGKVPESLIDDAVKRILKLKFDLGLFDDPYKYCNEEREKNIVYSKEHQDFAREAGKKSIVLLKNETNLLPISKDIKNIAVIGPLANDKDAPLGNWRARGVKNSAVSLIEGIQNAVSSDTKVMYVKGCDLTIDYLKPGESSFLNPLKINKTDTSQIQEAVNIAKKSDVVVLALGEDAYQTGEGRSQTQIGLAGVQPQLLEAVYKANKNVVLVLINGRPLQIDRASEIIPSILECWQLGSQSGNAIADVLFGDYNPSGKLAASFPYHVGQEPLYYNHKNTGRPYNDKHVTYSSYTDSPAFPLYPFGFGLSYTTFSYDGLVLSNKEINKNSSVDVTVNLTNTGKVDGEEVVQLYIRDLVGSLTRPVRELKGFQKILLKAGETKKITFTLDEKSLQFYTANKKWEVEPGDFEVYVGGNSKTELKDTFTVLP